VIPKPMIGTEPSPDNRRNASGDAYHGRLDREQFAHHTLAPASWAKSVF